MGTASLESHIAVWVWVGSMHFYFVLSLVFIPLIVLATGMVDSAYMSANFARFTLAALFAPVVASAALPITRKLQPAWTQRLGTWVARHAHKYFNLRTVYVDQEKIKMNDKIVFALEPHGVLPMSVCGFVAGGLTTHPQSVRVLASGACFKVPIMRHVYTWCGADSVDKHVIQRNLDDGMSVVLCPGGVQEAALVGTKSNTTRLYVRARRGMVRLAISNGVPIVPCFAFGTESAFSLVGGANHSPPWLKTIGRFIGFLPMIFTGVLGLPMAPPPPGNYTNVIGTPIDCGTGTEVVDEKVVDRVLQAVIEQYEVMFAKYNPIYGTPNLTLSIE